MIEKRDIPPPPPDTDNYKGGDAEAWGWISMLGMAIVVGVLLLWGR